MAVQQSPHWRLWFTAGLLCSCQPTRAPALADAVPVPAASFADADPARLGSLRELIFNGRTPSAEPTELANAADQTSALLGDAQGYPAEPAAAQEAAQAVEAPSQLAAPARSLPLPNGLFNPMPGGFVGGYPADTGLDIAGLHRPVYAIGAGTLDYSEPGHTRWSSDDKAVRLRLDQPITVVRRAADGQASRTRRITHVWYAHLSKLRFHQPLGAHHRRHVDGGELLGISGVANRSPHLHLGLLLDGVTHQRWGSYLLDDECRAVLGGFRRGQRLPQRFGNGHGQSPGAAEDGAPREPSTNSARAYETSSRHLGHRRRSLRRT